MRRPLAIGVIRPRRSRTAFDDGPPPTDLQLFAHRQGYTLVEVVEVSTEIQDASTLTSLRSLADVTGARVLLIDNTFGTARLRDALRGTALSAVLVPKPDRRAALRRPRPRSVPPNPFREERFRADVSRAGRSGPGAGP